MKQYRKKPITIEAVQFSGLNPTEIKDFVGENCKVEIYDNEVTPPIANITIHTLEGDMEVSKGDYVIKGVQGEFYPCKPDIFQQTYELEKPSESLEDAAHLFSQSPEPLYSPGHRFHWDDDALFGKQIETAFIAGAEWQKKRFEAEYELDWLTDLKKDLYELGRKDEREQMMKDAKDGYVSGIIIHNNGDEEHYAVTYPNGERPHSITDKVKIIIL